MNVLETYQQELATRGYAADIAQLHAVQQLQHCYEQWLYYKEKRNNRLARLLRYPVLPRGVYLWGGVGRGKSFLMDCFYACVPLTRKTRIHFHEFMRDVHCALEGLRGHADPLDILAKSLGKRYRLICFDEFHISDIADAMILYRLLDQLFIHRVQFVMTSNYHPDDLYPNGLHRDRLLPAIALLHQHMQIVNVDAGVDYRLRSMERVPSYLTPSGVEADQQLAEAFAELAEVSDEDPILHIEAREIHAYRRAGGVVWFRFQALCGGPRSQNDYLEIAQQFHTLILSDVPAMSPRMAAEARRFTWLIDILYDHKVKLLMSAQVAPEQLYVEGSMAGEFTRTVSRLIEMQSKDYLNTPRRY